MPDANEHAPVYRTEAPTLITPHLVLRSWQPEDAEALYAITQEAGIFRYFPRTTPPPRDRIDKYIARHRASWQERKKTQ